MYPHGHTDATSVAGPIIALSLMSVNTGAVWPGVDREGGDLAHASAGSKSRPVLGAAILMGLGDGSSMFVRSKTSEARAS
jgi:hypothetical protein